MKFIIELLEDLQGQKQKRLEFLEKTYGGKWKGLEGYDDIKKFLEKLGEVDPSHNGAYMQWMAKLMINSPHENKVEDLYKVKDDLVEFEKNKAKITNKDINAYKNFQELFTVIEPFTKPKEKSKEELAAEKDEAARAAIRKDIETVYDGTEGWVKIPTTKKASQYLGQLTRWCTAS